MKTIEMTTVSHPQSGKEVAGISILGRTFVYSDSRGYQTKAGIEVDFANQLINSFESAKGRTGLAIYYPERLKPADVVLSWWNLGNGKYELKIHSHNQHVWTSQIISTYEN